MEGSRTAGFDEKRPHRETEKAPPLALHSSGRFMPWLPGGRLVFLQVVKMLAGEPHFTTSVYILAPRSRFHEPTYLGSL